MMDSNLLAGLINGALPAAFEMPPDPEIKPDPLEMAYRIKQLQRDLARVIERQDATERLLAWLRQIQRL